MLKRIGRTMGAASVATALLAMSVSSSQALNVTVYPDDPSWVSEANSGGGSSAITDTAPRSGLGSLELRGDRTRFRYPDPYANLGLLSDVSALAFDWMVALDSVSALGADYTPALRLLVSDPNPIGNTRSWTELIWEGAYNGYSGVVKDSWYETDVYTETMWRWEAFVTESGGAHLNQSVSAWASDPWYSDDAFIYGISVGVGSGVGAGYHAFADNVTLGSGTDSKTWNFETRQTAVPDGGVTLMLLGIALAPLGILSKRRRS